MLGMRAAIRDNGFLGKMGGCGFFTGGVCAGGAPGLCPSRPGRRRARARSVVAHELVHLIEPHHTPQFWARLERALPDFAGRKQWLAEQAGKFTL